MKPHPFLSATTLAALAGAALAQQSPPAPPAPAPEVARFQNLIGTFEGSGTLVMEAGAKPEPWTATAVGTSILGGHAVQFDETIQSPMGPLEFRTLYGFDRERARPVCYWVGSMGGQETSIAWADADTLVGVEQALEEGQVHAQRWKMKIQKDGYTFELEGSQGAGAAFKHVEGSMRRTQKPSDKATTLAAVAKPDETMAPLAPLVGTWDIAGKIDMPEMKLDVTARETVEWIAGGSVLAGRVEGEPGGYRCDWYIAWDANDKVFRHIYATNMGEIGSVDGRLHEGKLITTSSMPQRGVPSTERGVLEFGKNGPTRAWSDRLSGSGPVVRSWEGTYKPAGSASSAGSAGVAKKFKEGSCCAKAAAAGGACKHPCCVEAAKKGEICAACNS